MDEHEHVQSVACRATWLELPPCVVEGQNAQSAPGWREGQCSQPLSVRRPWRPAHVPAPSLHHGTALLGKFIPCTMACHLWQIETGERLGAR